MNYEEAVNYIAEVPRFTTKNKAENTVELLRRLDHPEEKYKVIHVAGTNGKGSVCAFLASILQHGGKRTGLFISPHLIKINERFQINQEPVPDETFLAAFRRVKAVIDDMVRDGFYHPTYFEILFAVGMVIFAEEKVEYLVMETGLGGRLDATNTVARPIAAVITSISLDHTEYLGDTVEQIAWEKAGIIKEGVPVIYDGRNRSVEKVILDKAREMHAPAFPFYEQMCEIQERTDKSIDFVLNNRYYDYKLVRVPYLADYQIVNSTLAMMTIRILDSRKELSDDTILQGIADTRWGGRMETVLPGVVLDGAHNAAGIYEFLKTVRMVQESRPVSLLFSAVVEKDYEEMIREICQQARFSSIVVTQIEGSRKVDAQALAEVFRKYTDAPVLAEADVEVAFRTALEHRGDGMLFCAGSLYLVGDIKAILNRQKVQQH
ncbi:MAG: folylpolyglutamate synthase/dihydrofolate synthase family protein [Lachnospiraceae bacterium]|nr:folylpolyglutamate synthase/dihydrofolate synthase family protein [Lachnospiraceae bacterium]